MITIINIIRAWGVQTDMNLTALVFDSGVDGRLLRWGSDYTLVEGPDQTITINLT